MHMELTARWEARDQLPYPAFLTQRVFSKNVTPGTTKTSHCRLALICQGPCL